MQEYYTSLIEDIIKEGDDYFCDHDIADTLDIIHTGLTEYEDELSELKQKLFYNINFYEIIIGRLLMGKFCLCGTNVMQDCFYTAITTAYRNSHLIFQMSDHIEPEQKPLYEVIMKVLVGLEVFEHGGSIYNSWLMPGYGDVLGYFLTNGEKPGNE